MLIARTSLKDRLLWDMLPFLLGLAVLLPLFSFWLILIVGRRLGKEGSAAAVIATGAIVGSFRAFHGGSADLVYRTSADRRTSRVAHGDHGEDAHGDGR